MRQFKQNFRSFAQLIATVAFAIGFLYAGQVQAATSHTWSDSLTVEKCVTIDIKVKKFKKCAKITFKVYFKLHNVTYTTINGQRVPTQATIKMGISSPVSQSHSFPIRPADAGKYIYKNFGFSYNGISANAKLGFKFSNNKSGYFGTITAYGYTQGSISAKLCAKAFGKKKCTSVSKTSSKTTRLGSLTL
mgnify:CR=1 FL=1